VKKIGKGPIRLSGRGWEYLLPDPNPRGVPGKGRRLPGGGEQEIKKR